MGHIWKVYLRIFPINQLVVRGDFEPNMYFFEVGSDSLNSK